MIHQALQERMLHERLARWKKEPELRKHYNNDMPRFGKKSYELILKAIWIKDEDLRAEFFNFEGLRSFAIAELQGKVQSNQDSILI